MKNEVKIVYYGDKGNKSLSYIYEHKDRLQPLLPKKTFEKFPTFQDLKNKVLERAGKAKNTEKLSEDDIVYFYIGEQVGSDLDKIFNEETYSYFLRKIKIKGPPEGMLFFFIVIRDEEMPNWTPPNYVEIFNKTLEEELKSSNEYIKKTVTLLKLEQGKGNFDEKKENYDKLKTSENTHEKITCNKCLEVGFKGPRYMCSECLNYNLCAQCESKLIDNQFHNKEHGFILINKPIDDDINQYKNVIYPKKQEIIEPKKNFTIQFKVANSGTKNLKECYFTAIKYGSSYLGCKKYIVSDDFEIKTVKDIQLELNLPEEYENGTAVGFFRMFSKEGLPFGDVIHITVFGGKK